jgi:hypothetical protein
MDLLIVVIVLLLLFGGGGGLYWGMGAGWGLGPIGLIVVAVVVAYLLFGYAEDAVPACSIIPLLPPVPLAPAGPRAAVRTRRIMAALV